MPATAPDFQPGVTLPGTKYTVVRQLGAGGMGVVYLVKKPPEIQGVLKLMGTELAAHEQFRSRFFDEVRILAQLDHPNIVRVFDYDSLTDGTPYYVMEVLSGRTLRDVLATVGRLPPRVAYEIARQLLEALHCAHMHDVTVVHRDIKPENIFLHAPKHGEPVVKLIDFGVIALSDRKHDGMFVGTWKYAAPEQIRGEPATAATDLYAVGLVLYEMLAGASPFEHYDSGSGVAEAHMSEIPPPVSNPAPWVPSSVVALVASALAKDPLERPDNAHVFAERLAELEAAMGDASTGFTAEASPNAGGEGLLSSVLTSVAAAKHAGAAPKGLHATPNKPRSPSPERDTFASQASDTRRRPRPMIGRFALSLSLVALVFAGAASFVIVRNRSMNRPSITNALATPPEASAGPAPTASAVAPVVTPAIPLVTANSVPATVTVLSSAPSSAPPVAVKAAPVRAGGAKEHGKPVTTAKPAPHPTSTATLRTDYDRNGP